MERNKKLVVAFHTFILFQVAYCQRYNHAFLCPDLLRPCRFHGFKRLFKALLFKKQANNLSLLQTLCSPKILWFPLAYFPLSSKLK